MAECNIELRYTYLLVLLKPVVVNISFRIPDLEVHSVNMLKKECHISQSHMNCAQQEKCWEDKLDGLRKGIPSQQTVGLKL